MQLQKGPRWPSQPLASLRVNFPSAIFSSATIGMASSLAWTQKLTGSHWFFKARTNPQLAPWLASLNLFTLALAISKTLGEIRENGKGREAVAQLPCERGLNKKSKCLSIYCRHFRKNVISLSSLLSMSVYRPPGLLFWKKGNCGLFWQAPLLKRAKEKKPSQARQALI